jgi:hypothetical protein
MYRRVTRSVAFAVFPVRRNLAIQLGRNLTLGC